MVQLPSSQSEPSQQMPDAISKLKTDYEDLTKKLIQAKESLLSLDNKQSTHSPTKDIKPPKNPTSTTIANNNTGISPQQLFELVSRNYENWQQAMVKRFENDENDDDNFSPFPNHDNQIKANLNLILNQTSPIEKNSNPIFNYNLLEALDEVSNDMTDQLRESTSASLKDNIGTVNGTTDKSGIKTEVKNKRKLFATTTHTLLNEKEIDFLRHKITQIIQHGEQTKTTQGFSLYDTKDEEGLHAGNSDMCPCCSDCKEYEFEYDGDDYDYDQGDYDLEEITRDDDDKKGYSRGFSYTIPPTHHIEVELNAVPECDIHGSEDYCDCPIFDACIERGNGSNSSNSRVNVRKGARTGDYDEDESDGPSCEFMFEYDHTGKLIPTYNNVAEKLREMELNGDKFIERAHEQTKTKKKGKKSKHKNKKLHALKDDKKSKNKPLKEEGILSSKEDEEVSTIMPISRNIDLEIVREIKIPHDPSSNQPTTTPKDYFGLIPSISNECCLMCQYQAVFGAEPRQMRKWYDQRVRAEEKRRRDFKKKLQNAKLKVLRRQKDWRQKDPIPEQQQKQKQQQNVVNGQESDCRETLENRIDEVD